MENRMINITRYILLFAVVLYATACKRTDKNRFVYNGRSETDIISLSSQVSGIVENVLFEEGGFVKKGNVLFTVNTDKMKSVLKGQQAQVLEIDANLKANRANIKQVDSELKFAMETLEKTKRLVAQGAATRQRQEELQTKVNVLKAKKEMLITNRNQMDAKKKQLSASMEQTKISIRDASIESPIDGVILNQFVNEGELILPGRKMAEIADLNKMEITVYVSLADLPEIKIGNNADVRIDGRDSLLQGRIKWIASESEFTPKTILTRETRTSLVYAVKIAVDNKDGILKIGMPVDVIIK